MCLVLGCLKKKQNSFITPPTNLFIKYLLSGYFILDTRDSKENNAYTTKRAAIPNLRSELGQVLPWGSGLRSVWAAKSLALAETPQPCSEVVNVTQHLELPKVCGKPTKKGV